MTTRCLQHVRILTAASLCAVVAIGLTGCSSSKKSAKSMSSESAESAESAAPAMAVMAEPEPAAADDYTALTRGQTFSVRLPTYCGSQRGWRLAPKSADDRFVKLLDRKAQQVEPGMSDTLDARAWDVFTFRAMKPGETNIEFVLDQPWHPEQAAVRTHVLTCNITPPTRGQGKLQQASVTVE